MKVYHYSPRDAIAALSDDTPRPCLWGHPDVWPEPDDRDEAPATDYGLDWTPDGPGEGEDGDEREEVGRG